MVLDVTNCHAGGLDVSEECPVAVALCQHHGAVYAELNGTTTPATPNMLAELIVDDGVVTQVQIVTTETCCINVNAASMVGPVVDPTAFEIERPSGTIRTTQEDYVTSSSVRMLHHAAWEVLPAGTYTYFLMNRAGYDMNVYGAWIKAIASDCLG